MPPVLVAVQSTEVPLVKVTVVAVVDRSGTGSAMVTLMVTVSLPPLLLAYTVWLTALVWFADGVPDITPLTRLMPLGRAGSTSHVAALPPLLVMVTEVMAVPRSPVMVVEDAVMDGAGSWIVNW